MGAKRQKTRQLAFWPERVGGARPSGSEGPATSVAKREPERPATSGEFLMEEVCQESNVKRAYERVKANRGAAGVDGMTVGQLDSALRRVWPAFRRQLLAGTYEPQPVRRVEIAKPGGGTRKLGIPTALDRVVQQAILQVLQPRWDPTFSDHSYGFRPGRSAHQAVARAQEYVGAGFGWVVDIDLEKFFDRVNHDMLMGRVAKRVSDKRLLKLLRAYLSAGVMEGGVVSPTTEGTPQGGPLSPLLSNLLLDDLDRELQKRGHRFVRYADDCNIYVRSERAGRRVMESITQFVTRKLKLQVNASKSAVAKPEARQFLGFTFIRGRRAISPRAQQRFRRKVRTLTRRSGRWSVAQIVTHLRRYLLGWRNYFGFCQTPWTLRDLDSWIRRRLRCVAWKQWRRGRRRVAALMQLGVSKALAVCTAGSSHGPWRLSRSYAMSRAMPTSYFTALGLPRLEPHG